MSLDGFILTWGILACPSEVVLSLLCVCLGVSCNCLYLCSDSPGEVTIGRDLTDSPKQVFSCVLERLSVSLGIAPWITLG